MTRQDVIRDYIRKHGPDVEMLEIGVDYGDTWHHHRGIITNYTGVDISLARVSVPMTDPRSHWFEMDSRQFWQKISSEPCPIDFSYLNPEDPRKWNFIYIDGCHDYEVAVIDVREGLKHLCVGGYMLIHDLIPLENGPGRAFLEVASQDATVECEILGRDVHRWGIGVCLKVKE